MGMAIFGRCKSSSVSELSVLMEPLATTTEGVPTMLCWLPPPAVRPAPPFVCHVLRRLELPLDSGVMASLSELIDRCFSLAETDLLAPARATAAALEALVAPESRLRRLPLRQDIWRMAKWIALAKRLPVVVR